MRPRFFPLVLGLIAAVVVLAFSPSAHATRAVIGEPKHLDIPGQPEAYYYRSYGKGPRPVIMFLHGRGGNPMEDCRKWARVASQFGWVVCPQGPEDRGAGARSWNNSVPAGKQIIDATIAALRAKYKGRVQRHGNILIGFSEGAFIAMQVGLHDAGNWNRWLILAANDQYWWGDTAALLEENKKKIHRVYLLTGENDEVAPNTTRVGDILKAAKVPVRVKINPGMGHEVTGDRMITNYRRPLRWLLAAP